MHIAFISSMRKPTTTITPGGAEVWAAEFLLEAAKRNYTFDLYATRDSLSIPGKINLIPIVDKGLDTVRSEPFFATSEQPQREVDVYTSQAYAKTLVMLKEKETSYDVVIDSATTPHFGITWDLFAKPLIVIGHSPAQSRNIKAYQYYSLPKHISFVFPSHLQNNTCPWIPDAAKYVIPHGVNIKTFAFLPTLQENNLVFLGRFDTDQPKGMEEAISVATQLDLPLDIYTYFEPHSQQYFTENIFPKIQRNNKIHFTERPQPSKREIFAKAKVMLFPAMYDEPFGLTLLESLAFGTPIVGFARGAFPDIIKDGGTGFLINPSDTDIRGDWIVKKTGIEGLCEAVERIYSMPEEQYRQMRANARRHVEEHFTIAKMVDQYENLFQRLTQQ